MLSTKTHNQSAIQHEQIQQSYAGIPLSMLVSLINGGLLFYLLEPVTPINSARNWLVLLILITLARLILYIAFKLSKPAANNSSIWGKFFTLGSFTAGCIWGSTAITLFPPDSIAHQVFIAFILAGMTAAAASTLSSYWFNSASFIFPALLPLIYRYMDVATPLTSAMGIMVALYLLVLLSSTRHFYLSNLQNIRLRYEAHLQDQTLQQFKSTLDRTLDCVFMFHADSLLFFYFNQGAMEQVGYTHDELLHMRPFDIKPDFTEDQFRHLLTPLLNQELSSTTFETVHQHKDGHRIPVEIFLQYIHPQNETPRFVAIVRDITERKRLDRIKDEFVSTVSHELRTPLTSLRGSLGLVLGGAVGSLEPKQTTLLNIAQQNTERLLRLINDLLDIQKIETGNLDFHFVDFNLSELIEKSISENQAYADSHAVQFAFTVPDFDCYLHLDPDRISQVMSNLLSNAAKFSPAGSDIDIQIQHLGQFIRVNVRDHGPGIVAEFEQRVFDKFTQSDATDQRLHGGTGLGLAISKSIIEKHHGQIGFQTQIGGGTTFYFDLPIAKGITPP